MDKVALNAGHPVLHLHPQAVQARVRPRPISIPQPQPNAFPQDSLYLAPRPAAPISSPNHRQYVQLDLSHLVRNSAPADSTRVAPSGRVRYADKLAQSMQDFAEADHRQAAAYGKLLEGTAKSVVYAPAGAVEAAGRTAIAMTGGEVVYHGKSPLNHVGDGLSEMGSGAHAAVLATDDKLAAMGRGLIYAPLAGAEAVARGAGVMAGATVRVVSESFVGQEFAEGYNQARGHH